MAVKTDRKKGLLRSWRALRKKIERRLAEFRRKGETAGEEELFAELAFCLFTPQSKARSCWRAVEDLSARGLLLCGDEQRIAARLNCVRFRNHKAAYLVEARRLFSRTGRLSVRKTIGGFGNAFESREWLVDNVRGMGYKEASHFLRNIGFGGDIAILDRHILKNLQLLGVIPAIPQSLTEKTYRDIEGRMRGFSRTSGIPLSHLDLLLWCRETGEIFK